MSVLIEKLRQFGNLPLLTALRLLTRLDNTDDEPGPRSYGRHETRAHEKILRRIRKASQRRNRQ